MAVLGDSQEICKGSLRGVKFYMAGKCRSQQKMSSGFSYVPLYTHELECFQGSMGFLVKELFLNRP